MQIIVRLSQTCRSWCLFVVRAPLCEAWLRTANLHVGTRLSNQIFSLPSQSPPHPPTLELPPSPQSNPKIFLPSPLLPAILSSMFPLFCLANCSLCSKTHPKFLHFCSGEARLPTHLPLSFPASSNPFFHQG